MEHFLEEVKRMRWMLVLVVVVLFTRVLQLFPESWNIALLLHKPCLASIGFIVAHIGYSQAFPYIEQYQLYRNTFHSDGNDGNIQMSHAITFVGVCVLRGLVYAAFIIGVTLGL